MSRIHLRAYALLHYALNNWAVHVSEEMSSKVLDLVLKLLANEERVWRLTPILLVVNEKENSRRCRNTYSVPRGFVVIHLAAYLGLTEVVKHILMSTDINLRDSADRTPISWAAANEQEETVTYLCEMGAIVNAQDCLNRTPLSIAAENGHEATAEILLGHGADIETRDDYGITALYWAADSGHVSTTRLLLEKGADQKTPLYYVAWHRYGDVVSLLLVSGVEPDVKDKMGQSPLIFMLSRNAHAPVNKSMTIPIALLLLNRGAEFNECGQSWSYIALVCRRFGRRCRRPVRVLRRSQIVARKGYRLWRSTVIAGVGRRTHIRS